MISCDESSILWIVVFARGRDLRGVCIVTSHFDFGSYEVMFRLEKAVAYIPTVVYLFLLA